MGFLLDSSGFLSTSARGRIAGRTGLPVIPLALGGVAVALRDRQAWLNSIVANRDTRRKLADVVGKAYGGDIPIGERDLHIGTAEFMAALEARRTTAPPGRG